MRGERLSRRISGSCNWVEQKDRSERKDGRDGWFVGGYCTAISRVRWKNGSNQKDGRVKDCMKGCTEGQMLGV